MKRRIIVALLSTVIFSLIIAYIWYTPLSEREPNTWYDPFGSIMTILIMFSAPAYLLGGVPISFYIDKYVEKEIIKLPIYLLSGFAVGIITIVIAAMAVALEVLWFGIYGSFASLIFFVLMLLTSRIKWKFLQ